MKYLLAVFVLVSMNVIAEKAPIVTDNPPKHDNTDRPSRKKRLVTTKDGTPVKTKDGGNVVFNEK